MRAPESLRATARSRSRAWERAVMGELCWSGVKPRLRVGRKLVQRRIRDSGSQTRFAMSCGVALAVSLLLSDPNVALAAGRPPAAADAPVSVAGEPLFADIVARSEALRGMVRSWMDGGAAEGADFAAGPAFSAFRAQATELAALDMQGHLILKERGTDGDLKCILRSEEHTSELQSR